MMPPRAQAGFSLIETLVSLAVIAGMAAMLFEAVSTNARAARGVTQRREAVMLGQSLLAQAAIPPGPGELPEQGSWGDLSWRFDRRPIGGGARATAAPLEEIRIDVVDRASGRRLLGIRTLRLSR